MPALAYIIPQTLRKSNADCGETGLTLSPAGEYIAEKPD